VKGKVIFPRSKEYFDYPDDAIYLSNFLSTV